MQVFARRVKRDNATVIYSRQLAQRPTTALPFRRHGRRAPMAVRPSDAAKRSGREFAAWLGLVPRQNSTGGKTRLGGITKRGNQYLRWLLINGASANLLRSKATNASPWVIGLRRRRPSLVVAVALANKTARIAWAVMQRKENYQRMAVAA